jgi:hypothetical protein
MANRQEKWAQHQQSSGKWKFTPPRKEGQEGRLEVFIILILE